MSAYKLQDKYQLVPSVKKFYANWEEAKKRIESSGRMRSRPWRVHLSANEPMPREIRRAVCAIQGHIREVPRVTLVRDSRAWVSVLGWARSHSSESIRRNEVFEDRRIKGLIESQ